MALRAFRSNPALGGFGGESSNLHLLSTASSNKTKKGITSDGVDGNNNHHHDAFGQIIKELVDNAVDACSMSSENTSQEGQMNQEKASAKRVRVIIEKVKGKQDDSGSQPVLRVTVSDNGCGMKNIEDCVEVFRSTKAAAKVPLAQNKNESKADKEEWTAGRYGIGLTLCLLHAQRLVPNSCASITSAPKMASHFTRASYVVDTEGDSVRCVKRESVPKNHPKESGTSVSLLVPGGRVAQQAWPRLAEYFARFQLSPSLGCSLEVMAPCLSSVPLFVRPSAEQVRQPNDFSCSHLKATDTSPVNMEGTLDVDPSVDDIIGSKPNKGLHGLDSSDKYADELVWNDGMVDDEASSVNSAVSDHDVAEDRHSNAHNSQTAVSNTKVTRVATEQTKEEQLRKDLLVAATNYLKRPIDLKNVSRSIQPIRCASVESTVVEDRPLLEVDMIVYGPEESDSILNDETDNSSSVLESENDEFDFSPPQTAKLILVRMVNRIPLLDGAEASACGLVQGLCSRQRIWTSFGLQVTPLNENDVDKKSRGKPVSSGSSQRIDVTKHLFVPTYAVRDSDQVAPFFQNHTQHSLFDTESTAIGEDEDDSAESCGDGEHGDGWEEYAIGQKRSKKGKPQVLMPAHLRLGNILIIVQIHAKPSCLPLPTLSKGRLPLNDKAIDDALEVGLVACLRSLQKTNPKLLLTAQQLKQTERDSRYCPAVAAAIASIVCKSANIRLQNSVLTTVQSWATEPRRSISLDALLLTSSPNSVDKRNTHLAVTPSPCQLDTSQTTTASSAASKQAITLATLGSIIEERMRLVSLEENKTNKIPKKKSKKSNCHKKRCKVKEVDIQDSASDNSIIDSEEFLQIQDDPLLGSKSTGEFSDGPTNYDGRQSSRCKIKEVQKSDDSDYETDDAWW